MSNVQTLLVVWQDDKTRLYYHIGTLSYFDNHYEFVYTIKSTGNRKLGDALKAGYMIHPAFPQTDKIYSSETLFPAFDRRIPSSDRSDFYNILADLGLSENASKMEILRATRGRLASDTYSFEQPLRLENDGKLHSSFFVHGMRHQNLPKGWASMVKIGSSLKLMQEPTNEYDSNAVAVYTHSGLKLGYVPTFYSQAIFSLLENGAAPLVRVIYLNEKSHPHWWLKVNFECEIPLSQAVESKELSPVMQ